MHTTARPGQPLTLRSSLAAPARPDGAVRLLIADPDRSLLKVLALALPRFGVEVETVASASDTLISVVRRRRDVLIVDEAFVAGETADVLRARVDRLIVTFSDAGSPGARAAARLGADGCLRKPFAISALLDTLTLTPPPTPGPAADPETAQA